MPTTDTPKQPHLAHRRASFPLASLALLITTFACLLSCVDTHRWRQQVEALIKIGVWQTIGVFGGAALFGAIVGLVFTVARRSSWQTVLFAPFVGILAGEIGISILLAPGAVWRTIVAASVLLIAVILLRVDTN